MKKEYQITLHNGELAIMECNPYKEYINEYSFDAFDNWEKDNADRPYYILTGEHGLKEGDVVMGDRVETREEVHSQTQQKWAVPNQYSVEHYKSLGYKIRQAARIKEQVKKISDCKYPHLTKLSDDYNTIQELNAEIDKFLSIDDGWYETPEQSFRCGVYFGYRHTVTAANKHTIEVIEGRIQKLRFSSSAEDLIRYKELEYLLTLLKQ